MIIDLGVAGVLILFTVVGIYQGLVPQLFRIGGLVLVCLLARPLARAGAFLLSPLHLPGLTGLYLGGLIVGIVVYAAFSFTGKYLSDRFINTRTSRMEVHSKLGGYLGFIKGALVALVALFILAALPEGYLAGKPRLAEQVRKSWTVAGARLINPLPELTIFDDLSAYQKLLKDPDAVARLKEQPAFQQLRSNPAVQDLMNDSELGAKLEQGDYSFLLADPKVVRVLKDPEVRRLLQQLDPQAALKESAEAKRQERPAVIEPEIRKHEPEPSEEESTQQEEPGEGSIPVVPEPSTQAPQQE